MKYPEEERKQLSSPRTHYDQNKHKYLLLLNKNNFVICPSTSLRKIGPFILLSKYFKPSKRFTCLQFSLIRKHIIFILMLSILSFLNLHFLDTYCRLRNIEDKECKTFSRRYFKPGGNICWIILQVTFFSKWKFTLAWIKYY